MMGIVRLGLALLVAAPLVVIASTAADEPQRPVTRTAGQDRIETAVAVSGRGWDSSSVALVATANDFPDALAAGALAAELDAPILLTTPDALSASVGEELTRLQADEVVVLGGTAAVSSAVVEQIRRLPSRPDVRRVAGADRFETAARLADEVPDRSGEVTIALGSNFPDAVSAGALSASPDRIPVLLTGSDSLPASTVRALRERAPRRVLVVGGSAVISEEVVDELEDEVIEVERLSGVDRYATSRAVAAEALRRLPADPRPAVFATGQQFPDALAAAALTARLEGTLLLVPRDDVPPLTIDFLRDRRARFDSGIVVGGSAAVSEEAREQLVMALNPGSVDPSPVPSTSPSPSASPPPPSEPQPGASWVDPIAVPAGRSLASSDRVHSASGNTHRSSVDGGATWSGPNTVPGGGSQVYYGGMDAQGSNVYLLSAAADMGGSEQALDLHRSTDDGVTWAPAVRVTTPDKLARRANLVVNEPYVHVLWHDDTVGGARNVYYRRSTDGGATWKPIETIAGGAGVALGGVYVGVDRVTGTVHALYTKDVGGVGKMHHRRSTDNGATWSAEADIGGSTAPPAGGERDQARPRIAAHDGDVIVAWEGSRDLSTQIRPIQGARSSDDGADWTERETFVDGLPANHHDLAVVGTVVHMAWKEGVPDSSNPVGYVYSNDAGATWSEPEVAIRSAGDVLWNLRADDAWVHVTTADGLYARRQAPR